MLKILKITQNKIIETPNAKNMVDCGVESQKNFNRNRKIIGRQVRKHKHKRK